MSLTLGKLRRMQQCSTPDGLFNILAIDHRDLLQQTLNPNNPDSISYSELVVFKTEITRALAPVSSAVLLDPEFGAAQSIADGALPGKCGLLVSLEASGYTNGRTARRSTILDDWSVEKIARLGAGGVKLRLNYHPEAKTARAQEALLTEVAEECRRHDIPLFLEPIPFSVDSAAEPLTVTEARQVAVESAARLIPLGVDVLVAGFPLEAAGDAGASQWAGAFDELNEASETPWLLGGAAASFADYLSVAKVALQAGASGVVPGIPVWGEAVQLRGDPQMDFVYKVALERMVELGDVTDEHGRPWTEWYRTSASDISEGWYTTYAVD